MINARAETVPERPAYRELVRRAKHRCLVLADGWYEWQKPEDPKQPRRPVYFSLAGGEPFCFAGLWTSRTASCTILTCEANDLSRPIHDRMPVVLDEPGRLGGMARSCARRSRGIRAAGAVALGPARACGPRTRS